MSARSLLSGDRGSQTRQLSDVLAGCEDFMDFDRSELRLVEPLRTLRFLHYSAWIALMDELPLTV